MRRRDVMIGLGAVALPRIARAQAPPVIGFLGSEVGEMRTERFPAFHQGLAQAGYVDGRDVMIEYRWANGHVERFPQLAAELVRRQVTVIAALAGIPAAMAAKAATTTIPIVFTGGFNPVEIGLVASLSRPGVNVTGVTNLGLELGPKRLEVVHELLPAAKNFALLVNPDHPSTGSQSREMQTLARRFGLQIRVVHARAVKDFEGAFASLAQLGVDGLLIGIGQPFAAGGTQLGELAARYRVPAISYSREFVAAGGLISYGGNRVDTYRLAGLYVGRILKGEKPADLPVAQSAKIEMIINMKSAKAHGLKVPLSLLGRADEVIE